MIQSLVRYASIAFSAVLVLSFVMFATDQSQSGTAHEVATLNQKNGPAGQQPAQPAPSAPAKAHGQPRRAIDDAASKLTKPFDGVVASSKNDWARKAVPTLFALLVFGFGLQLLAGYLPKPKSG